MIVCVAGMHRSGTSLMAQWLARAGLPLTVGGAIAPDVSNPRGYYEDPDFVRLHAGHLRRVRRWSFGWNVAPGAFLHFTPDELGQATALIAQRSALHANWGWKDPRATLFLADWKQVIPALKVIIVWRPCADVVHSLLRRGLQQRRAHLFIDPLSAIRLWRAHNLLACAYHARFPGETLLVAATQAPEIGLPLQAAIAARFDCVLPMTPMTALFEPELVHPATGWLRRLCAACGSSAIEARLQTLSLGNEESSDDS